MSGRSHRAGRDLLLALLVATALFRVTQNMALTTLSLLGRESLGLHAGAIGVVGATAGLAMATVTFTVSHRVRPHHAALSAAGGMAVLTVSLVIFSLASSLTTFVMAALLLGIAGGLAIPGLVNAVVYSAGSRRERAIGLYTITLSLGLAFGPVLESLILSVSRQDVRTPFVLFSILPALGAVIIGATHLRRRPNPMTGAAPSSPRPIPPGTGSAPSVSDAPGTGGGHARGSSAPRWRGGLLGTRTGRVALIAQLLYAIPFVGITVFGALVSRVGFGVSPARAQIAFTVFFVLSFGARSAVTVRAPITHKMPLFWTSAALTATGLTLLGIGHGFAVLLLSMGVLGIPHGLTFPLALATAAESTDMDGLPRANATLLGSTNLVTVIVPLALGAIIPVVGYRGMALSLLAPVAVCGALLFTQRTPQLVHREH